MAEPESTPAQMPTPGASGSERADTGPQGRRAVAIVTGGARGLGRAIALELARRGSRVAVLDRDLAGAEQTVDLVRAETGDAAAAAAFEVDVSDEGAVRAGVAGVVDALGAPLILVNNAGVLRDDLLFKMTVDGWETIMNVHLRGAFLMSREVQRHMVAAKWGRIVNLSSTSALGNAGQANYSAAKAGIQGFTKTLALELGRFGVTANAVAPGFTVTDMTRSVAERVGVPFEQLVEREAAATAVRRVGSPDDIANAVAFFVAPESGFVSGQVLYVAGGPRG
ncbi:SDR family oxidoreductase [Leucobacter musarum]|uniref:SDR family oxidoreductase n=2 Tax=Leucobacter TaxID=55968 RepID=UPI000B1C6A67|nr:SDR family oxidoreductase [Leucobacter musarum]